MSDDRGIWSDIERVPETNFYIRERHSEYWLDFEVWEAVAWGEGEPGQYTIPEFFANGADSQEGFTPEATKKNGYISGFIKWDGCCQWWPAENYLPYHFDSLKDAEKFGRLMAHFYELGAAKITRWWPRP